MVSPAEGGQAPVLARGHAPRRLASTMTPAAVSGTLGGALPGADSL